MTRNCEERMRDVRRLVSAARAVSRDPAIADALVRTTGLSKSGVALALAEHLETSPAEGDLRRLVERTSLAEEVHVVLSANVFTGALRALAVARAAADCVTVAPSRREPVFARALVEQACDPGLSIDLGPGVRSALGGEIHVYGHDETIARFRASAPQSVRVRGHGSGLGIACVTDEDDLALAARAVARDVAAFDQRGCLSPRVVLFLGRERSAEELSEQLDRALESVEERVPRGRLAADESAAAARYASTIEFVGRLWRGKAHLVGLAPKATPLMIPPPGRHLHVAVVESLADARARVAAVANLVAAVGSDSQSLGGQLVDHPVRVSALGQMQRPPLDGPVDLRA
jgi:hypothetical protein